MMLIPPNNRVYLEREQLRRLDILVFRLFKGSSQGVEVKDYVSMGCSSLFFMKNDLPMELFEKIVKDFGKSEGHDFLCHERLKLILAEILFSFHTFGPRGAKNMEKKAADREKDQIRLHQKACQLIQKQLEDGVTVEKVARELDVSRETLNQNFKSCLGITVGQYIDQVQIHLAKELLEEGTMSVQKVSEHCGHRSVSTFIRKFSLFIGKTPHQYRKNHQSSSQ